MSEYQNNSIFWVETAKIKPNPFQPRREFEKSSLEDLADSIRQYGVLQPLVVTRVEETNDDGGISVSYELIAGERRLRASILAGLEQIPVIIRKETSNKIKLELAIIENLQREDLSPIDRALAFEQLYKEFNLTHSEIGKKMGKSRVYVSNSLRLLSLPDDIKQGLINGKITEGHTRPLLMLSDRKNEQNTLYREITLKKMSVRESEKVARSIAQDRIRKKKFIRDPRIRDFEKKLSDNLGTRVQIEQKEKGGKITIDYFSVKDLESILSSINKIKHESGDTMMDSYVNQQEEKTKDIISSTTHLNFNSSKKIIQNINEKDEKINDVFLKNKVSEPGLKQIKEFVENKEYEIVEHKNALPEFVHKINEEIVLRRQNNSVNENEIIKQDVHANKFDNPEIETQNFEQKHINEVTEIGGKKYQGYDNTQNTFEKETNIMTQDRVQDYNNQQQDSNFKYQNQQVQQQFHQGQPRRYKQPIQSTQQVQSYNSRKKKSFLGRLFS